MNKNPNMNKVNKMGVLPPDPVFCLKSPDMGPLGALCFQDPERLLAGTQKGIVHLWDMQTNRSTYHLSVGDKPILNIISTCHESSSLITQEKEGILKSWALTNSGYKLQKEIKNEHIGFCKLAHSTCNNTIISPHKESDICIYSTCDLEEQLVIKVPENLSPLGNIMCICPVMVQGQQYILAGHESGILNLWDVRATGKCVNSLKVGEEECLMALDYDPITNRGVCGGSSEKLYVFSIDRNTLTIELKSEIYIKNSGIHCLKIRRDLKVFATGGWDGRVRIFSWKSLRPLAVLTEHKDELMDIAYSNAIVTLWKAPIMATGGVDGKISLWDIYN